MKRFIIQIKYFILFAICFFLTFTQINSFFSTSVKFIITLVGCFICLLTFKRYLRLKFISWLLLYFVILCINFVIGDKYFSRFPNIIQEIVFLIFPACISTILLYRKKFGIIKLLLLTTIALIVYFTISSVIIESIFPGAIRSTVFLLNTGDESTLNMYYRMGMTNYALPHAVPILIPALVVYFRDKKEKIIIRYSALILIFLIFVLVYVSYAMIPFLMCFVFLILSFLVRADKSIKTNLTRIGVIMFVCLPLLFSSSLMIDAVGELSELFGTTDTVYKDRIEDIQGFSKTGNAEGDLNARFNRYDDSLSLFDGNILLGTDKQPGEHSIVIDRLAVLGLIGIIPYLAFLYMQSAYISKFIDKKNKLYYFLGISAGFMLLLTKNMGGWETWFLMFTILPLMIWMKDKFGHMSRK